MVSIEIFDRFIKQILRNLTPGQWIAARRGSPKPTVELMMVYKERREA
jgi:hypothetical protein